MRNITQWRREIDKDVIRVYRFRGKLKTAEAFLEGTKHTSKIVKHDGNYVLSPSNNFIPSENIEKYKIYDGGYILKTSTGEVVTCDDSFSLFHYMFLNGYRYIGTERVRNTNITEEKDPTGILAAWVNWGGDAVNPDINPIPIDCKVAREGWVCTRAEGHSGPCAAVKLEPLVDTADTEVKSTSEPVRDVDKKKVSLLDRFLSFIGFK